MSGTFSVEWQPDGVLLLRRTGVLSVEDGAAYGAAVKDAMLAAPPVWGVLVDLRDAGPSGEEVRTHVADILQYGLERHVRQIAVVTTTAADGLQQRRISTAPGLLDASVVGFYTDFDAARAALKRRLSD